MDLGEKILINVNILNLISQMQDKRDFDLNLQDLINKQRALAAANDSINDRTAAIPKEITHIRDKIGNNRKKAKLEELEKRVERF